MVGGEFGVALDADEEGGAAAGGDEFAGEAPTLEGDGEGSLELLDGDLDELAEVELWMGVVYVLHELGDDFGVCGGLHGVPASLEVGEYVAVVGDDAVVDEDELVVVVGALGMGVEVGGWSVGGPASVSDAAVNVEGGVHVESGFVGGDVGLKGGDLSTLLEESNVLVAVPVDGDAGGVVAAVLQSMQSLHQDVHDLAPLLLRQEVQVREDPTHSAYFPRTF